MNNFALIVMDCYLCNHKQILVLAYDYRKMKIKLNNKEHKLGSMLYPNGHAPPA